MRLNGNKQVKIMKKIYNYFLIALAAVAVASCVNEGLGENNQEQNGGLVFTVQSESVVKSVLDENVTPMWVSGDAISVNGVSCTLIDAAAGTFDGSNVEATDVYYSVYPYATENAFEGSGLSAVVPANQIIPAGLNVAPGALVAACKSEDENLSFKNCVALLQIDIPIADVRKVVITVDGENEWLAGPFEMDLDAEPLTPVAVAETASKTVTLTPAEGTFEPGTYYATVIPGEFKGFTVKFEKSEEDHQTITNAKTLTLARSTGRTLGSLFTYNIGTAEELMNWAKNKAKFTAWDVVKLTDNITLTADQAAQYIEADMFKGTFDGNNKKISGLTTPLFGDLYGSVKDLEIEANIVHDGKPNTQFKGTDYGLGILAHYLYKDYSPTITGVTTRGSIKASGVTAAHNYFIGGLAGSSNGVPMTKCVNYASISTENITISGSNYCCVGGVLGLMQTAGLTMTNCDNYGNIDVQSVSVNAPAFGGVFGRADGAYEYNIIDCDNMAGNLSVGNLTWPSNLHIGGVFALTTNGAVLNMTDCDNAAYVKNYCSTENAEEGKKYSHLGGILGVASASKATLTNCKNSGKIENATINANGDASKGIRHCIGGIVGRANNATTVDNCDNSGEVCATADKGFMFFVGGITGEGSSKLTIKDCDNTGKVSSTATSGSAIMGGVSARLANGGTVTNCTNNAAVTLAGTVLNGSGDTGYQSSIAGVVGVVSGEGAEAKIENCKNLSAAVVNNASKDNTQAVRHSVGGIVGRCVIAVTLKDCANEGKVMASAGNGLMFNIGGMTGYSDVSHSISNCENSGEVSSSLTKAEHLALGGISGRLNKGGIVKECNNNGLVCNTGVVTNTVVMGGMVGYNVGKCPVEKCTNNGTIKNESATTATGNGVAIGGIIGRSQGTGPTTITSCHNTASLVNNVTGGATLNTIDMGGMVGFCSQNSSEVKTSTVNSTLSTSGTVSTTRIHALIGNVGGSSIKLTSNQVAGTVNGTTLNADNFAGLLSNGTVTATDNTLLQ